MRWTLVSSRHHPGQGGIGASVAAFINVAKQAGWHIDLITRPGDQLPPGVNVHPIRTLDDEPAFAARIEPLRNIERIRPYRYGLWSLAAAEYLANAEFETDVIEFVDVQGEGFVSLASRQVRQRWQGVPMIINAHTPMWVVEELAGMDEMRFGRAIYHQWERQAIAAADGIIAPSRRVLEAIGMSGRGRVIPPVIEEAPLRTCSLNEKLILLIGSAEPNKGVDTWAQSLNRVLSEHDDAKAMLIGPDTPTSPDGGSMTHFCKKLIEPGLRSRFRCPGQLSHHETLEWIERASLVVVPSLIESFSYVAAEAIMRGAAVVVSDGVGIAEHLPCLKTFPAGDVDSLAESQLEILGDEAFAAGDRQKIRMQLIEVCCGDAHLKSRELYVASLTTHDNFDPLPGKPDAIREMSLLLADMEKQEREQAMMGATP